MSYLLWMVVWMNKKSHLAHVALDGYGGIGSVELLVWLQAFGEERRLGDSGLKAIPESQLRRYHFGITGEGAA